MSAETIERPAINIPVTYPDADDGRDGSTARHGTPSESPPTFGRCPMCDKALRPVDKLSGAPTAPPVNAGINSRAKCGGCGTIIVYIGNYEWRVALSTDYSEEDLMANRLGL